MKVRIERIGAGQKEEALLRLAKEDGSTEKLQTDSWKKVSILCKKEEKLHRIDSDTVFYVESVREIQSIHTADEVYETRERLYVLEKLLPASFIRISRSVILNLDKVRLYRPILNGLMEAGLENGESVYISRKYLKEVRDRILEEAK